MLNKHYLPLIVLAIKAHILTLHYRRLMFAAQTRSAGQLWDRLLSDRVSAFVEGQYLYIFQFDRFVGEHQRIAGKQDQEIDERSHHDLNSLDV